MNFNKVMWLVSVVCWFCFVAASSIAGAENRGVPSLEAMKKNEKLLDAPDLLSPFEEGQMRVNVIVVIEASDQGRLLADKSRKSKSRARDMFVAGGPVFYDLENESVRQELLQTVTQTVADFAGTLDSEKVLVDRQFKYFFGFSGSVTVEGLQQLVDNPRVVSIEKDRILQAHLGQGIPLMNATSSRSIYDGSGISIAICDTGIDTSHPRLGGGGSPIFNSKVIGGYDTGDNDGDPRPDLLLGGAHGTACAGIAAGDLGSVGDYIGGVAPGAKLYAIKISTGNTGSATTSAMIAGWEWAVTHKNDDPLNPILVISTSFGGGRFYSTCNSASAAMTTAAANAVATGITIFASSGNDGYCDSTGWPACISYVNSVGAVYDSAFGSYYPCVNAGSCAAKTATAEGCSTGYYSVDSTSADMVTSYSNSASFLTMMAPANKAFTADIVGQGGYSAGDYSTGFGGTSAACPYAAGAAAVLQHAAKTKTGKYLTPVQVQSYLTNNGDTVTDSKVAISKPRVNLGNSVAALGFPWHTIISAISASRTAAWGADSAVCCSISPYTFSLSAEGVTKRSKYQSCSSGNTWEGWQETGVGSKRFYWNTSGSCTTYSGSFEYSLSANNAYLFQAVWTAAAVEVWASVYSARVPLADISSLQNKRVAKELVDYVPLPPLKESGLQLPQSSR